MSNSSEEHILCICMASSRPASAVILWSGDRTNLTVYERTHDLFGIYVEVYLFLGKSILSISTVHCVCMKKHSIMN